MSDTVFFGKTVATGQLKAILLYGLISACVVVGMAFMDMTQEKWTSLWWMQKTGWVLLLIGNVANTIKAATSSSTRPEAK